MKKVLFFIFSIFIGSALFADTSSIVLLDEVSKDVEFTALRDCNIGFSRNMVNSTIEPDPETTIQGALDFDVDETTFDSYTTGLFYLFVQVFTVSPVEVYVSSHNPMNGSDNSTLGYSNVNNRTKTDFSGSAETEKAVLISETESSYSLPRVYNVPLEFSIPISSVNYSLTYSGTFEVTLEVK